MPMPREYANASRDFDSFLADVQDELNLTTRNMAYTTVQAVLVVFRRRLSVDQALSFANVLPAVLRAIFVSDWDLNEERQLFLSMRALNEEVKKLRSHHNFSPDNSIQSVARVIRRHIDEQRFNNTLVQISPEASNYWATS